MKRLLWFLILLGLAGCGISPSDPNRLVVTEELRQACAGYAEDFEIAQLIASYDANRARGTSRSSQLGFTLIECDDAACVDCRTATLNQVYSYSP